MSLVNPTHAEAPLVALVATDLSTMTPDEVKAFQTKIRELRAVSAQQTKAVNTSKKSVESKAAGMNIDDLL